MFSGRFDLGAAVAIRRDLGTFGCVWAADPACCPNNPGITELPGRLPLARADDGLWAKAEAREGSAPPPEIDG
jgi:hypothetical protein